MNIKENKINKIPKADFAIISGSSTNSIEFPEQIKFNQTEVIKRNLIFNTPYGKSPSIKLFKLEDKKVLAVEMHGWRNGVERINASEQIFWVFHQAGVKKIISEGGVGIINKEYKLRDIIIPSDFIDFKREANQIVGGYLIIMTEPICRQIGRELYKAANRLGYKRVFNKGVYFSTEGPRFESKSEVRMIKKMGGAFVGQSLTPEVYLARNIGACFAGIYLMTNYAEGILKEWNYDELKRIYKNEGLKFGQIILTALKNMTRDQKGCHCLKYRKKSLIS